MAAKTFWLQGNKYSCGSTIKKKRKSPGLKPMVWLKIRRVDPETKKISLTTVRYEWDDITISCGSKTTTDKDEMLHTVPDDTRYINIVGRERNFKETVL